ncbi:MAG: TetR/AcrR family transcriptional regulator [Gammaproteobacteria bacterium]
MKKPLSTPSQTHGVAIKQERGRLTHDRLIATGFRMLELTDMQELSIAELTREAGYSVGAFYSRFRSKDEFFDALIAKHLETRTRTQIYLFATLAPDVLVSGLLHNVVGYYWDHRKFWRAVLVRSVRDPDFWEPVRKHGHEFTGRFIDRLTKEIGRSLNEKEEANIAFAFILTFGAINSTIINQHGPIFMGQKLFIEELIRAFSLISDFDNLVLSMARKQLTA